MGKSSDSAALMAPAIADHWWGLPHSFEAYCLPICCRPDISPVVQASILCTLTYRHARTHVHPETSHSLLISESTDGQHYCAQSECFHSPHNGWEKAGVALNRVPLSPRSLLIWDMETDPHAADLAAPFLSSCSP